MPRPTQARTHSHRVYTAVLRQAVEGTTRVLKACHAAGIKRVVVTSSCAAVYETGVKDQVKFGPDDWSDLNKLVVCTPRTLSPSPCPSPLEYDHVPVVMTLTSRYSSTHSLMSL